MLFHPGEAFKVHIWLHLKKITISFVYQTASSSILKIDRFEYCWWILGVPMLFIFFNYRDS
jgi:hypothetical protein